MPGRRHQKPWRPGQRDAEQLVPHSLSGYNEDPADPEVDPAPLPSVQMQHSALPAVPLLLCIHEVWVHHSLSHASVTLLLGNIKSGSPFTCVSQEEQLEWKQGQQRLFLFVSMMQHHL